MTSRQPDGLTSPLVISIQNTQGWVLSPLMGRGPKGIRMPPPSRVLNAEAETRPRRNRQGNRRIDDDLHPILVVEVTEGHPHPDHTEALEPWVDLMVTIRRMISVRRPEGIVRAKPAMVP